MTLLYHLPLVSKRRGLKICRDTRVTGLITRDPDTSAHAISLQIHSINLYIKYIINVLDLSSRENKIILALFVCNHLLRYFAS